MDKTQKELIVVARKTNAASSNVLHEPNLQQQTSFVLR